MHDSYTLSQKDNLARLIHPVTENCTPAFAHWEVWIEYSYELKASALTDGSWVAAEQNQEIEIYVDPYYDDSWLWTARNGNLQCIIARGANWGVQT